MYSKQHLEDLNSFWFNFENFQHQYQSVLLSDTPFQESYVCKLEEFFNQLVFEISSLQWKVIECIDYWRKHQQQSIISGIIDWSILGYIQQCNSIILKFYISSIDDLNKFLNRTSVQFNLKSRFVSIIKELQKLMQTLVQNAFLVIDQPRSSILKFDPLTIISNAKFEVKLGLLFDYQLIYNQWNKSFQINVQLLKEEEIKLVLSQGIESIIEQKPSFNIINKSDPIFSVENQMFTMSIVCMLKVDMNRRGHNPKALPVAEEKFKFIFWTSIHLIDGDFSIHTFSLPVNVLSRKDYRNSYATIIWDNAFPLENREVFETRDSVSWVELSLVLNSKFKKDVGMYLYSEHLDFIHTMIPNRNENDVITWEQFSKVTLPMRQFTFFEWFYKILVLVREQLSKMYCDGLIHGFISSEIAEKLLLNCVDGTFLIRFSETFCGAISIAYVKNRKFDKLFPWDLDRLRKISLSHTIKCSDFLLYLYPNIPKDDVFCKYYIYNEVTRSITGKDYSCDTNIAQVINTGQGNSGCIRTINNPSIFPSPQNESLEHMSNFDKTKRS